MKVPLHKWINTIIKGSAGQEVGCFLPFCHMGSLFFSVSVPKGTAFNVPHWKQRPGFHQTLNHLGPWSCTVSFQNCEKINHLIFKAFLGWHIYRSIFYFTFSCVLAIFE
jgi:hypothetical protein